MGSLVNKLKKSKDIEPKQYIVSTQMVNKGVLIGGYCRAMLQENNINIAVELLNIIHRYYTYATQSISFDYDLNQIKYNNIYLADIMKLKQNIVHNNLPKKKILLTGYSGCGKSTVFKHIQKLYDTEYEYSFGALKRLKQTFIRNIIDYMQFLAKTTKVSDKNERSRERIASIRIRSIYDPIRITKQQRNDFKQLLTEETIQNKLEGPMWMTNHQYVLDNMHKYYDDKYLPTFDDLLHFYDTEHGPNAMQFQFIDTMYEVIDVTNRCHTSSKLKYHECFDNINIVMFVMDLNAYNKISNEDVTLDELKEQIKSIPKLLNNNLFQNAHVVLLLNKFDCFEKAMNEHGFESEFWNESDKYRNEQEAVEYILRHLFNEIKDGNNVERERVHCFVTTATDGNIIQCIMQYIYCKISFSE